MTRNPIILLGRAQADPDDVRGRSVDGRENIPSLFSVRRPVLWRVSARDNEGRIPRLELAGEKVGHAWRTSIEEMPMTCRLRTLAEREHQVWPVNPAGLPIPMQLTQPDERHAVGRRKTAPVDDSPQARIFLAFHYGMDGAHIDVTVHRCRDPLLDHLDRLLKIDRADADTKDVDTGDPAHLVTPPAIIGGTRPQRVPPCMKVTEPRPSGAAYVPRSADHRLVARAARIGLLAATDLGALVVAGAAAYIVWALPALGQSATLYVQLAPLTTLFLFGYAQAGLYPGFGLGPVETLRRLSYVTAFGFLVLAAFSFALKLPPLYSRVTFLLAFAFSLATVPVARVLAFRVAHRWRWWSEPVAVIGAGERASRAIRSIQQAGHFGYRPAAVLAVSALDAAGATDVEGVPIVGGVDQAPALAAQGIRIALLETRRADPSREREMVDRLQQDFQHVVLIREYDDLPVEGLQIRNLGNLVGIEYTNNLLLHSNRMVKRTLDLAIGSVALIALAPVILFAAAIIRVLDGGPAFFVQERAGLDGQRIAGTKDSDDEA